MYRSKIIIGALAISAIVIAGTFFYAKYDRGKDSVVEKVTSSIAPVFSFPNEQGENISLEGLEGKVKVINFWASWSPYSKDELNSLNRIQKEFGSEIIVVALSRDQYPPLGQDFLRSNGIEDDILYLYDKNDDYFKKVEGFAVPETVFLNDKDEIILHKHGPITYDEIRTQVENMLN